MSLRQEAIMERKARVETGIIGLDKMLLGGFVPGSANLLRGAPGTGKTLLARLPGPRRGLG